MRLIRAALLLLLLPLLAGCFGAGGVPLPPEARGEIRDLLTAIDDLSEEQLSQRLDELEARVDAAGTPSEAPERRHLERDILLLGYCWERRGDTTRGALREALENYSRLTSGGGLGCGRDTGGVYATASSIYSSVAYMRVAQVSQHLAEENRTISADPSLTEVERQDARASEPLYVKRATSALERLEQLPVQPVPGSTKVRGPLVLLRRPSVAISRLEEWLQVDAVREARRRLDEYRKEKLSYHIFEFLVRIAGGENSNTSYILAIALIAILAKLITTPLSAAQFRSMQAMQRLQPEIKKLQEKYKEDKQQLAKAQMDLFKEYKINPLSSCLPMLIQMPILIWVYYGIRYFVYRFEGVHFLYIDNLANPDVLLISGILLPGPLLLLYGVSMYVSQKLIATPAATPEQQQQQKMMAYMMPIMLVLILKGLPAAFILYWFLQNILMTGHQYLIMRSQRPLVPAGALAGARAAAESSGPTGPPKEAMDRLSQGTKGRKKKRKRR
jgi:YidC/Oxa1 family membrane protein insertase